nr:ATP-binding cassette domain-containing protein [Roseicitreum antarcticum]
MKPQSCLARLTATIAAGEVLTIMGPSGCGKSTILSAIIGALPGAFTQQGKIWLGGHDITALPTRARGVGIMFQDDILFPHLSVGGNLGFALPRGITDRRGRIETALSDAGLHGMADRDPATLSGGQRARVALMRTLLAEPAALLLDEPFSRLDADRRTRTRDFVFQRARDRKLPVVLVTHDREDALAAGGPVVTVQGAPVSL